ncbi:MAG TPA: DUF2062 domain-containing protein [Geobacterales bacterium]|nr:DUF2062 domain-containing protein [Geobacterales bacterium]
MFDKALWKKRFKRILSLDNHPGHIAAGFAVGVFIGFTPLYGLHTVLAIVAAFVFRLNKVTCLSGTWINSPITFIPVTLASYKLGNLLLGQKATDLTISESTVALLKDHAASLILGSSVLGLLAAVASYFLCYQLVVRFRRRDETLAEKTRESIMVGEDLE